MDALRFGCFEFDPETRELRRSGLRVRLPPQPLEALLALLERPGEVVERAQLRSRLWGTGTFVSFDRSLNFCINRLRHALDDDARHPRFVETVPGRGYRFIAPVSIVAGARRGDRPPAQERPGPSRGRPRRRGVAALVALALLLLAGHDGVQRRDAQAEALYARARSLCGSEGWRESVPLYVAALARLPDFAAAHAGLARSYLELGESGALDPDQAYPAARDAARQALAIEEQADARLVLGRVLLVYDWNWRAAEQEIRRGLELLPHSSTAWSLLARFHSARGDHAEALRAAKHAEAIDPSSLAALEESAFSHYRARRFDEAARRFRRLAERRPEEAHHRLFAIHRLAGRHAEAVGEAAEVMRLAGVPPATIEGLRRRGPQPAEAAYLRGTLDYLQREAGRQRVSPERFALLWAALGEPGEALGWLSRAADERSPELVTTLQDPVLDPLRRDPRFVDLARRVGSRAALAES